jgi:RNA polymerase sigma-70 factor (ECF subfamily)
MVPSREQEERLLEAVREGSREAAGGLFELHRLRLARIVHLRLDQRIRPRVDPADVLQDTYLVMSRRIDEFLAGSEVSFFVWLRFLAVQKVTDVHRQHLGALKRTASREVSLDIERLGQSSADVLARQLLADSSTPCRKAMQAELRDKLLGLLQDIPELQREILVLRHLEQLTIREVAEILQMNESSVSTRHVRALMKLKCVLGKHDDFRDLLPPSFG